ncbi:MAG: YkgJ family cysteine cluster protein [Desulfobacterales bacterium]|nr:YkgJ family cysteine cluster protein [Desulfobacterales bacterium]
MQKPERPMIEQAPRIIPIAVGDRFAFDCNPGVACFNACCRDLSQALTPYDVLRLTRGLGLRTGEFLRRYTACRIGPGSGLPVVSLVPGDPVERTCPFRAPSGCRVYRDRPSSCRTYPLMRAVRRDRATGRLSGGVHAAARAALRRVRSGPDADPGRMDGRAGARALPRRERPAARGHQRQEPPAVRDCCRRRQPRKRPPACTISTGCATALDGGDARRLGWRRSSARRREPTTSRCCTSAWSGSSGFIAEPFSGPATTQGEAAWS